MNSLAGVLWRSEAESCRPLGVDGQPSQTCMVRAAYPTALPATRRAGLTDAFLNLRFRSSLGGGLDEIHQKPTGDVFFRQQTRAVTANRGVASSLGDSVVERVRNP